MSLASEDRKTHYTILCRDFNSKVGLRADVSDTTLGIFGSEGRSGRGETLLWFQLHNNLFLINSFFHNENESRWTWKSPNSLATNENDFIITDNKHKFTTGSDQRMVTAKVHLNSKRSDSKWSRRQIKNLVNNAFATY